MRLPTEYKIQCPECGGTDFARPDAGAPNEWVSCATCTQEFALDELRQVGVQQAKEAIIPLVRQEIEASLKKAVKNWK